MANAILLGIGDELVNGLTVDTNSAFLAQLLRGAGFDVLRIAVVPDDEEAIRKALREAVAEADLVITTGGLGPTSDDLTTACVARLAGVELHLDDQSLATIESRFRERGLDMPANNRKQAYFPAGSEILPNPAGTAPGFLCPVGDGDARSFVASLPGVPREMRAIAEGTLIGRLVEMLARQHLVSRVFSTVGLSESALDERLEGGITTPGARISFRAAFPRLQVRASVAAASEEEAEARLDEVEAVIRDRLGHHLYAVGNVGIEEVVGAALRDRGLTLSVAESCTGGLIGHRITDVPGSSAYFAGGVVAYSNELKVRLLGVDQATLDAHGAVSEEVVREMADGIRQRTGADLGVATSGIAGPGGGTPEKPVGTVAIAVTGAGVEWSKMYSFGARSRSWVKEITALTALDRLRLILQEP